MFSVRSKLKNTIEASFESASQALHDRILRPISFQIFVLLSKRLSYLPKSSVLIPNLKFDKMIQNNLSISLSKIANVNRFLSDDHFA